LSRHEKKLAMGITQQTDSLLYAFDKGIIDNRSVIFDYAATKSLLFHSQQQFFTTGKEYQELLPTILKDCQYLSDLTHTQVATTDTEESIAQMHTTREKIYTFRKQTHIILIILTLWIAKLFLP
jgi:hypothetical protein